MKKLNITCPWCGNVEIYPEEYLNCFEKAIVSCIKCDKLMIGKVVKSKVYVKKY